MTLPSTKPLDGEFWYVLDDTGSIVWRPRPKLRGDFYLSWLGQNKNVFGAGLVHIEQGRLTHICTHGTPYFWLQPYQTLPDTCKVLRAQNVLGADTMTLDFSLSGWGMRDQSSPPARRWSDTPVSIDILQPRLVEAVRVIVRDFRSEGEPLPKPEGGGLLARTMPVKPRDPLDYLLDLLSKSLDEPNVVPVLIELVKHDVNVLPGYRQSDFFEVLPAQEESPPPSKVARLVLSAIYHMAPLLNSRQLNNTLLLNSLRQRHPFDVTWGADFLVKCFGMSNLIRLLHAALLKEQDDQMRGNILDLLQDLGYGISVGYADGVMKSLNDLLSQEDAGAFGQVVSSHFAFVKEYLHQKNAAVESAD